MGLWLSILHVRSLWFLPLWEILNRSQRDIYLQKAAISPLGPLAACVRMHVPVWATCVLKVVIRARLMKETVARSQLP